jgi:hypothetical protein
LDLPALLEHILGLSVVVAPAGLGNLEAVKDNQKDGIENEEGDADEHGAAPESFRPDPHPARFPLALPSCPFE